MKQTTVRELRFVSQLFFFGVFLFLLFKTAFRGSFQLAGGSGTSTGPEWPVWHLLHWAVQFVTPGRLSVDCARRCDPYTVVFPVAFAPGHTTVGPVPPGA